jgi:site-specific recombinase XerC
VSHVDDNAQSPHNNAVTEPFGGLLASFQLALDAENKSPKTVENYTRAVVQFAEHLRSHGVLDDVKAVAADDVRRWLTGLQGRIAPSTEYRNYSGLRQFSPGASVRASWTSRRWSTSGRRKCPSRVPRC